MISTAGMYTSTVRNELQAGVRSRWGIMGCVIVILITILMTGIVWYQTHGFDTATTTSMSATFYMLPTRFFVMVASITSIACLNFERGTSSTWATMPASRLTVYAGKMTATFLFGLLALVLFYILSAAIIWAVTGGVSGDTWTSFGFAIVYMFMFMCLAYLLGNTLRNRITTLVMVILLGFTIFPLVGTILGMFDLESWFMPDVAGSAISGCFTGGSDLVTSIGVLIVWLLLFLIAGIYEFVKKDV